MGRVTHRGYANIYAMLYSGLEKTHHSIKEFGTSSENLTDKARSSQDIEQKMPKAQD